MKLFLPKLMKCTIIWGGLIFAGLQTLTAQQAGGGQSPDKLLQQVYKTVDGKAIVDNNQKLRSTQSKQKVEKQENDDLQAYIDKLATTQMRLTIIEPLDPSAVSVVKIDLSQFDATDRTTPLYVRNGQNCEFVNGTLSRNAALKNDAVLIIQGNSSAKWGDKAILSGGGFTTGNELVRVESGSFIVSTGTIKDASNSSTRTLDNAVYLKVGTTFEMTGGLLYNTGGVDNQEKGTLSILGGQITGGGILATSDFNLSGEADVSGAYVNLYYGARIIIQSELKNQVDCIIPESKEDYIVATRVFPYAITQADVDKFIYSDPNSQQTKKWEYVLLGDNILLKEKKEISNEDDLQKYLDGLDGKGTEANPEVVEIPKDGITITKPLGLPHDGYYRFTGGTITVSGPGGCIHGGNGHYWIFIKIIIRSGGGSGGGCDKGLWFDGGGTIYLGQEGGSIDLSGCTHGIHISGGSTVNMYGGTISGCEWGVYNDGGTFNLYGGTISGNTNGGIYNGTGGSILKLHGGNVSGNTHYDIYSLTCFWLSGSCETYGIWLGKGACIYVTSGIKYKWEIHFIDGVETGKPIIIGDGYGLKEGDITIIVIYPPKGWGWHWDGQCGCVQVSEGGDTVIDTDIKLQDAIDKATGTCSGQPTVIEITGTIEIDHDLFIKDKSIKLTGGTLTRNLNNREYFIQVQNGCLTLENITIDGRKSSFMEGTLYSPIEMDGVTKLTINEGTIIKNHYVNNGHAGLIWEKPGQNNKCTVKMNGGSIYDNEVPLSGIVFGSVDFDMRGGDIYNNKVYELFYVDDFKLLGGSIENNTVNKITLTTGILGAKFIGEQKTLWVNSNALLYGDATLGGQLNVIHGNNNSYISIFHPLKSELMISHAVSAAIPEPTAGTIIAQGWDSYILTEDDLAKFYYKDNKWGFALDKVKNTIVLAEAGDNMIKTGDDLQDYLDRLAREGKMGTEEKPEKIDKFVNPVTFNKPVNIPDGMVVKLTGGTIVVQCLDCGAAGARVPKNSVIYLDGTTVKGDQNNGRGGISTIGKLVIEDGSEVDNVEAGPGGKLVLDGGTIGMIGKTIDCIDIDEGAEVDLKKGEITGHVKTISDISLSGDVKIGGTICLLPRNEIRLYSPLRSDLKIGYESIDATPGTVVVSGTGGYRLTQNDLFYLTPVDSKYKFELNGGKIVIADPTTANDEITPNQVSAYASDGKIILTGLTPGEEFAIYGIDGHRVYKGKADGFTVSYPIKSNGVYFVRYQNTTIKVASAK